MDEFFQVDHSFNIIQMGKNFFRKMVSRHHSFFDHGQMGWYDMRHLIWCSISVAICAKVWFFVGCLESLKGGREAGIMMVLMMLMMMTSARE